MLLYMRECVRPVLFLDVRVCVRLGLNLINAPLGFEAAGVMRYLDANGIEEGDLMKCATSVRRT